MNYQPEDTFFTDCVFKGDFMPIGNETNFINCVFLNYSDNKIIDMTNYMMKKCHAPNFNKLTKEKILMIVIFSVIGLLLISIAAFWLIMRNYFRRQNKLMKKYSLEKSIMNDFC